MAESFTYWELAQAVYGVLLQQGYTADAMAPMMAHLSMASASGRVCQLGDEEGDVDVDVSEVAPLPLPSSQPSRSKSGGGGECECIHRWRQRQNLSQLGHLRRYRRTHGL